MKAMYEITAELAEVLASMEYLNEQIEARAAEIEANGGELPMDLADYEGAVTDKLDKLLGEDVPRKLENLALVRRDMKARMEVEAVQRKAFADEAQRYSQRVKSIGRTVERLKDMSRTLFRAAGMQRVDGDRIKTRMQSGALTIRPANAANPPDEFCVETWAMPSKVAHAAVELLRAYAPGLIGQVTRHREFSPELARVAVERELERAETDVQPGDSVTLMLLGVVVSRGATVVDW